MSEPRVIWKGQTAYGDQRRPCRVVLRQVLVCECEVKPESYRGWKSVPFTNFPHDCVYELVARLLEERPAQPGKGGGA